MVSTKYILQTASDHPRIRLLRWRVKHSRKGKDIFTVVEQCEESASGFLFTGTKDFVEGDRTDIEYSLLPLTDNDYTPHPYPDEIGPGIHFIRSPLPGGPGPLGRLRRSITCWDLLQMRKVVQIVNNKFQV